MTESEFIDKIRDRLKKKINYEELKKQVKNKNDEEKLDLLLEKWTYSMKNKMLDYYNERGWNLDGGLNEQI